MGYSSILLIVVIKNWYIGFWRCPKTPIAVSQADANMTLTIFTAGALATC